MNIKRIAALGAVGGAVAVWMAAAASSGVHSTPPQVVSRPAPIDLQGAELAREITRLHERLRPGVAPIENRDLFRYAEAPPSRARAARLQVPGEAIRQAEPVALPAPTLKLIGIAEDQAGSGAVRTAIISDGAAVLLVKVGEPVGARYRVANILPEAVELSDSTGANPLRLELK
jgi:hypothetical protein